MSASTTTYALSSLWPRHSRRVSLPISAAMLVILVVLQSFNPTPATFFLGMLFADDVLYVSRRWLRVSVAARVALATLPFVGASLLFSILWFIDGRIGAAAVWAGTALVFLGLGWAGYRGETWKGNRIELTPTGLKVRDHLFQWDIPYDDIASVERLTPSKLDLLDGGRTTVEVTGKRRALRLFRSTYLRIPEADVDRFIADLTMRLEQAR
jgi:hypothetical protein